MRSTSSALVLLLALAASPVGATTYVMMSDQALADRAPVIVEVSVLAVEPAPSSRLPSTDYLVQLEGLVKGSVPGSTLVVRVPGGVAPNGRGLRISGAPQFAEGERALLFLSPREDGTYGIVQLMLGAFHQRRAGGVALAIRDLEEATRIAPDGTLQPGAPDAPRGFEAFRTWLADRAAGVERPPDYFLPRVAGAMENAVEPFKLLKFQGTPIRWFAFDGGGEVVWRFHQAGYNGSGGGQAEFQDALRAWTDEPATPVRLPFGGTTSAAAGFTNYETTGGDGLNVLLFEDPNDEIEDEYDCLGGGVLAIGGPGFDTVLKGFNGTSYFEALEAEIITNDGTECFFVNAACRAEVYAHELGHTLGLAHSCDGDGCVPGSAEDEALMRATVHLPCRGAVLFSDDRAGLRDLYGSGGGGGGKAPNAPSGLSAQAVDGDTIQLGWQDNSGNETGFVLEMKADPEAAFAEIATVGANVTSFTAHNLALASIYSFRVKAVNAKGSSAYSNEAVGMTFALIEACQAGPTTLCLNNGRFRVEVTWDTGSNSGPGTAVPLTNDTGFFWFFDEDNVELVVKALNACGVNGHYWVFASGLTNVRTVLTVVDTQTGQPQVYVNPQETPFVPVQDNLAFPTCP